MNVVDAVGGIACLALAGYAARTALLRGERFEDVRANIGLYAADKGAYSATFVRVVFVALTIAALAGAAWMFTAAF